MKRIYPPMSNLVRREQEKLLFRLKTAVNYGTVKRQAGAEVSRFEVSSLEGFFFRSQQLTYKIVHTCIDVISSEVDTTENMTETTETLYCLIRAALAAVLENEAALPLK